MFRKTIIILILTFFMSVLSANILIDVYHSNYGLIDRTVLVFDSKPDYSIFTEKSSIWITIANCRKDISLRDKNIDNNQTLEGYKYHVAKSEISFVIELNSSVQKVNNYNFDFKLFELQENVFKLVFDIFAIGSPQTSQEFQQYIEFYEKMGEFELVKKYKQYQKDFESGYPVKQVVQEQNYQGKKYAEQEVKKEDRKEISVKPERVDFTKKSAQPFPKIFETVFFVFIGLNFLILIIFFFPKILKKKTSSKKVKEIEVCNYRSIEGFADREFQKEIIKKLVEFGWENDEISKELNLNMFALEQLRLTELSQEEWAT